MPCCKTNFPLGMKEVELKKKKRNKRIRKMLPTTFSKVTPRGHDQAAESDVLVEHLQLEYF